MHISDPHFHRLPGDPRRYASKRLFGALNLVLRRRFAHPSARARRLVERLQALGWSHLLITGDLTQLGTAGEFALAREVLAPLLQRGAGQVTVIPGNHDRYTPDALRRRDFERHFGEFAGEGDPFTRQLTERWWMVAWDSAAPAGLFSAAGRVRPETLRATEAWLAALPAGARVIVANHYPLFFPPPHRYKASHDLANQEEVRGWLLRQPVQLYLHGHVHHNWLLTVEGEQGPITVVNSASSTRVPRFPGESAFHRIVLEGDAFRVEPQSLD
jgi:3',5'-cyclic AMP phosphodiesterase CpdA